MYRYADDAVWALRYRGEKKGMSPIIEIGLRVGIVLRYASCRACCSRWCDFPCAQSS
jgi:hypothetical protein